MPNLTLQNSVNPSNTIGLQANTLFVTGPALNCFWKMDLGYSKHVKAVLIIGDVGDILTKLTTLGDWKLTVGDNLDPLLNPTFFT